MSVREAGQSAASAEALAAWQRAYDEASQACTVVIALQQQLRKARAAHKALVAAEREALRAYEATPYGEVVA